MCFKFKFNVLKFLGERFDVCLGLGRFWEEFVVKSNVNLGKGRYRENGFVVDINRDYIGDFNV